jgi:hypothetical protein
MLAVLVHRHFFLDKFIRINYLTITVEVSDGVLTVVCITASQV